MFAHGSTCASTYGPEWWTTPDLNPTPWTPEPYTLWLRFVLGWLMVCGMLCGVCGVLCGVCGVQCMGYGPCRRAGLVDGRVLMSQAWRQSRRRDRVVALVVGRVVSVGRSCRRVGLAVSRLAAEPPARPCRRLGGGPCRRAGRYIKIYLLKY